MIYIDANVFIYAVAESGPTAAAARRALADALRAGAATSALTVDEVVWNLGSDGKERAIDHGRRLLDLPGLRILPVLGDDVRRALDLMSKHGLQPRDAIHAAVATNNGCKSILSGDADFDAVPGLKRLALR